MEYKYFGRMSGLKAVQKQVNRAKEANEVKKLAQEAKENQGDEGWLVDKVTALLVDQFKQYSEKTVRKAVKKLIKAAIVKFTAKAATKKVPVVGFAAGLVFGGWKALQGDFSGAGMEVASGAASTIPGAGTALSVGVDCVLLAHEMRQEVEAELKNGCYE